MHVVTLLVDIIPVTCELYSALNSFSFFYPAMSSLLSRTKIKYVEGHMNCIHKNVNYIHTNKLFNNFVNAIRISFYGFYFCKTVFLGDIFII